MKYLLTQLMIACLFFSATRAQISGKVVTTTNEPPQICTVQLVHLPDSVVTASQVTSEKGHFEFRPKVSGNFIVKARMVGFAMVTTPEFTFTGKAMSLNEIVLKQETRQLKQVTVVANIPQLEQKSDRLVVSLTKINTTGENALDILKRAPGIRLDKDDNILFRGNVGVNVMIDGKNTYMSGYELSAYLKSLPASAVSKIELIANPPGNYDAEGTAGIVNLIMKRNRAAGLNGNTTLTAGYGKYGKLSGGLNFNYNSGKVSLYSRVNEDYSDSYNRTTLGRQIGDELYQQSDYWHPLTYTTTYTIGADFFATKKSTFGIMLQGYNSPEHAGMTSNSHSFDGSGAPVSSANGATRQKTTDNKYNINLNYSLAIDSSGQKFSIDADYVRNNSTDNENYLNAYFDGSSSPVGDPISLRSFNPVSYNIYAIKGDYVYPFAKKWKAEAGFKSSWVKTDNNAEFDSLKATGYTVDPLRSNHFLYKENINAAYVTLGATFGKNWDLKASIRGEQTVSDANSMTLNEDIKKNYLTLFPSLFVTYKFDGDDQLNASYSSRISRPNYTSLNPFIKYIDPYTAIEGNPFLLPSKSNSLLLSYTYKNFQVLSLSYLKVNDAVTEELYQNDQTKESINKFENLGNTSSIGASTSGSFNLTKWCNMSYEIDASYDKVSTVVEGSPFRSSKLSWSATADENFILPAGMKINLSGLYAGPSVNGLARMYSASIIDAGIKKSFSDNRMTLSFKAKDIFSGSRYKSVLLYNNVNTTWLNKYESHRFSLGFTYLFGNDKIRSARDRKTGTGSEENRM